MRSSRFCSISVGALFGQTTGRNRRIELLLGRVDQRLNEAVDGLSFLFRDLRKRVSVAELFVQLILRQPEVGSCGLQPREQPRVRPSVGAKAMEAPETAEEKRRLAGIDPLLELRTLLLGKPPLLDGLVDAVLQRLPKRSLEGTGLDAELGCRVVDYCLALVARGHDERRTHCCGRAERDDEQERRDPGRGELDPAVFVHSEDETRDV